jgi:GDP-L-fucose synthase
MNSADDVTLVIGADGFIGRHLAATLETRGERVHRIGRAAGDLADWPAVERAFAAAPKAKRMFHLVTRHRMGQVQYGIQGELLAINARIHLNLLEAWRRFQPQAKLISTGSSCAYPELDRPMAETDLQTGKLHPSVRGYGLAKHLLATGSECYASQFGLTYLHLILATVYGPGESKEPDRTHLAGGMIDRAVREQREGKREFTVWGDPGAVRDLLYVSDQVEAMLAADRVLENCLVNCSATRPVAVGEVAHEIVAALDWNAEIVNPPGTFKGAHYKALDATRFLAATGWTPRVGLAEGIGETLRQDYRLP